MKQYLFSIVFFISAYLAFGQSYSVSVSTRTYKVIDGNEMEMTIYKPEGVKAKLPAIVFFFGGGWVNGNPEHFELQANYLASRGIIAICPDYRTKSRHGTSPFESVKDAKSAIRYIKLHANELEVNPDKIVASGGSAGGHLAACTAIIDDINEASDDISVSTVPMALILFNPVVDTGKRGYGSEKVKGREFEISPVHHITQGVPTTLIMHGKDDTTVPFENVVRFQHAMQQNGNKCKLIAYKNQSHGFFNYKRKPEYFRKTLKETEKFLVQLQLLKGKSWLKKYCKSIS
jgi:acetyl esterase/lipase